MDKTNKNSHSSFIFGCIESGLLLVILIIISISHTYSISSLSAIIGLLIIGLAVTSIFGLIKAIKSRKEPSSTKKIFGLTIHFGLVVLTIALVVVSIFDLIKVLN